MKHLFFLMAILSLASCQTTKDNVPQKPAEEDSVTALKNVASVTRYPASLKTAILRQYITKGISDYSLLFNTPETIKDTSDVKNYLFHPKGGDAKYTPPNKDLLSKQDTQWIFSKNWQVDKIGRSAKNKKSNEIIAFLPHVSHKLCKDINTQHITKIWAGKLPHLKSEYPLHHSSGTPYFKVGYLAEEDKDQDGIPRGSKNNILPQMKHNKVSGNENALDFIDIIDSSTFTAKPFGCYDLSDDNGVKNDGPYVYYNVLTEN